jgi:hypothetical protein
MLLQFLYLKEKGGGFRQVQIQRGELLELELKFEVEGK